MTAVKFSSKPSGRWRIICGACFLVLSADWASCRARGDESQQGNESNLVPAPPDLFCGPRCVHFLSRWYGHDEELVDVIRDIQWPDIESGASLDAMRQALERRGISTRAISVRDGNMLTGSDPAIVFLPDPRGGSIGHYVVWLPSSTVRTVEFWSKPPRAQQIPAAEFWGQGERVAILTSTNAIEDEASSISPLRSPLSQFVGGGLLGLGLFFLGRMSGHLFGCAKFSSSHFLARSKS